MRKLESWNWHVWSSAERQSGEKLTKFMNVNNTNAMNVRMSEGKKMYVQKDCKFRFWKKRIHHQNFILNWCGWFFSIHKAHCTVILSRAFKADTIPNNMWTKYLLSQRSYCKCSVQNLRVVLIWAFNWNISMNFFTLNQE